jgi:hypothetical protein
MLTSSLATRTLTLTLRGTVLVAVIIYASISSAQTPEQRPSRSATASELGIAVYVAGDGIEGATSNRESRTSVSRYTKTAMAKYVEYNSITCAQISSGSWSAGTSPDYGTISYGTTTGQLSSGDCPGVTFTFGTIFYTWDEHSNRSSTDSFSATWKSPGFNIYRLFNVTVPVVRPAQETEVFSGWWGRTIGLWEQTLRPPSNDPTFDFSWDLVREFDPGYGGRDTCWMKGSAFDPMTAITGGTWNVDVGNTWGYDHVGWFNTAVRYYRRKGRAPCEFRIRQQMKIRSPADPTWTSYGRVNVLGGVITRKVVSSKRAGQEKRRRWP